tara:strand:- start:5229 stop:5510 length:282 start_codon:yes stop_codon:yes gene_type:complete
MANTITYALIETEEPTETLLLVEALKDEPLKPVIEAALFAQHCGVMRDYETLTNGSIEVHWLDDCGVELVYQVARVTKQRTFKSWAVEHRVAA